MIPSSWSPYRRRRDDELVGYLTHQGETVLPVTLFGYPLAEPSDLATAQRVLESSGLSVLAEPWWLEQPGGDAIRVKIREVSADRLVVVSDDFGYGGTMNDAIVLEVPEPGRLRR